MKEDIIREMREILFRAYRFDVEPTFKDDDVARELYECVVTMSMKKEELHTPRDTSE